MVEEIVKGESYYFINKEIVIVKQVNLFNLAIVRYVDSIKEFVVDINFIDTQPSKETFISVIDLEGGKNR
ncbi:hypothetical protein NLX67_15060 [Domibacillus sp. A3M-37]|uniref:hypothetical protein n=1 Tax=Domibacillus sp. A3M-37 TaxID=2962037 RepID=UPI0020B80614|nr:hypothetical protein [Domibacillus sp. A3M-37]MCP3763694.1 hypothetical protein [Domibacillus sp. A3M-37]